MAEELHAEARRQIRALLLAWCLGVNDLRPKGTVDRIGTKGAGVDRSGHELPERLEVLEGGLVGIIVMRGSRPMCITLPGKR
jgi:hypothetical protein